MNSTNRRKKRAKGMHEEDIQELNKKKKKLWYPNENKDSVNSSNATP
jgi:hypothetical protein